MEINRIVGEWRKDKVLGTGGFGTVVLWINSKNEEPIALKECRWGHDAIMTTKHRQRWKLEVDIMKRLSHINVVKSVVVPKELDAPPGSTLPLMAMEYCNGGDLRKHLSRPENCCGFPEHQVRLILRHIVSAVSYLHSMRIIHRDLKPENIVMQEKNGQQIYKLIDLGYAKELDQGSLCTSFVGTLQYLAPELFLSQSYSCTVDFWSLGLVTHEVITGQRPFLPNFSPAQWIPLVRLKSSDDITAFVNSERKVEFSTEICPFHQISRYFKSSIEDWLRIMLEFDPDLRGQRSGVKGFDIFQKLINKKVLQVFCINSLQVLTFEPTENHSVSDLQYSLSGESGISVEDQLLLLPKGIAPEPSQRVMVCWTDPEAEEVWPIFLLSEKGLSNNQPVLPVPDIPSNVQWIMKQPKELISFEMQRMAWREAVHCSHQLMSRIQRLTQGYKAYLLNLLRRNSFLHKTCVTMQNAMAKLQAKMEFFQCSLDLDIKLLEEAENSSLTKLRVKWKKSTSTINKIEKISAKIVELEGLCNKASERTMEPQKSPYARSKHTESVNEMHNAVVSLYGNLKKKTREERSRKCDNTEMVRALCSSIQFYESHSKDMPDHFRQILKIRQEVCGLIPKLESCLQEIGELEQKIIEDQKERQRDIWKSAMNRQHQSSSNNNHISAAFTQPLSRDSNDNSDYQPPYSTHQHLHLEAADNGRSNPFNSDRESSGEGSSLSGPLTFILGPALPNPRDPATRNDGSLEEWALLLRETARSSQRIRKENADLRNSLGSMVSMMTRQQEILLEEDEQMFSIIDSPSKTKL